MKMNENPRKWKNMKEHLIGFARKLLHLEEKASSGHIKQTSPSIGPCNREGRVTLNPCFT